MCHSQRFRICSDTMGAFARLSCSNGKYSMFVDPCGFRGLLENVSTRQTVSEVCSRLHDFLHDLSVSISRGTSQKPPDCFVEVSCDSSMKYPVLKYSPALDEAAMDIEYLICHDWGMQELTYILGEF